MSGFHSIHIAVTVLHTQPGVAEKFINDVREITKEILKNPPKDAGGSVSTTLSFLLCSGSHLQGLCTN